MRKSQVQLLLRVVLHVAIALLLSVRSAHLGRTLHPFQRAVANNWVHLLFYVNVHSATIRENRNEDEAVETLPHFLLEIEEEIAANIGDEFFSGGFAARASALPVGALFTIEETRQHLHGAVDNYFLLADVALDSFVVFNNKTSSFLSPPLLTVRADVGDETRDELYTIMNGSDCCDQWPAPLRMGADVASRQETRAFLDALDAIELKFVVGMTKKDARMEEDNARATRVYQWTVAMRYDLLNQGHLEVTLNYNLDHVSILKGGRRYAGEEKNVPPVLLDTSVALHWVTLVVIVLFQGVECFVKWGSISSRATQRPKESRRSIALALAKETAKDIWFCFALTVNVATAVCLLAAWRNTYQLSLDDSLCFTFACCCALQWGSLVRYLRVNTRFRVLELTLRRGFPRVLQFLTGVLPIFVGFVLFGTVMFGMKVPRFRSASTTATALFSVANGDEIYDTFNDVAYSPWIGQIYIYCYIVLFSYVVLMVCIGIIEDAFFSALYGRDSNTQHGPGSGRMASRAHGAKLHCTS
uniref:Polycystin cation channel PKD1/PKD2 domain-containing protein n=1 Tax=Peronospora matthiolae TaxID=2874970 RepID=A0AAV1TRP2_9STRA